MSEVQWDNEPYKNPRRVRLTQSNPWGAEAVTRTEGGNEDRQKPGGARRSRNGLDEGKAKLTNPFLGSPQVPPLPVQP